LRLHTQVGSLLQRVHLQPRTIWLALVGQNKNDVKGVLGGDPQLTEQGVEWARCLDSFLTEKEAGASTKTVVLGGTLRRDVQMRSICAKGRVSIGMRGLNEMCAGDLDSLSYDQIDQHYPQQSEGRHKDKLRYRFPGVGGESYQDVILRLHEFILFSEQTKSNVMLVVNKAVLRVVWAYFEGMPVEEMPFLAVPGHTQGKDGTCTPPEQVIELKRSHSGFETSWVTMGKDTVPDEFWEQYKDAGICCGFAWYGKCNLNDGYSCMKRGKECLHVCAKCRFKWGKHPIERGSCPHEKTVAGKLRKTMSLHCEPCKK